MTKIASPVARDEAEGAGNECECGQIVDHGQERVSDSADAIADFSLA
jgi:hypothetical protein